MRVKHKENAFDVLVVLVYTFEIGTKFLPDNHFLILQLAKNVLHDPGSEDRLF